MEAIMTITGNVGSDVEHRVVTDQATVATFRMACTPRVLRAGEWTDAPTTWLTVQCWRTLADNVSNALHKGEPVIVTGRLRTQSWTTEDGELRERSILEATSVGHDLTRGISNFVKNIRYPAVEVPADRESEDAPEDAEEPPVVD